jgi:transcriptional regulator with XRE-family HTH domain
MIRDLRKDKGLTQVEVSKLCGISRVTLGKLERGEISTISIKTLDIILNILDYEIDIVSKNTNSFGLPNLMSRI